MRIGFPPAVKNLLALQKFQERWVRSWVGEYPLEESMATPMFLPGGSHGQRSLVGYHP